MMVNFAITACWNAPQTRTGENRPAGTVVSGTNIKVTPPPGQSPPPEVVLNGNLAERTNQKRSIDLPAGGTPPAGRSFDAPENSSITTTMNSRGQILEVRVFKNHPQLDRVEATWTGPQEKLLKIYLKDGSTREVVTSDMANLKSMTTQQLLELVGNYR